MTAEMAQPTFKSNGADQMDNGNVISIAYSLEDLEKSRRVDNAQLAAQAAQQLG